MSDPVCLSLLDAMQKLTDPRKRRGIRHPYSGLLGLTLLGLLCRQSDFTSIARWAKQHWDIPSTKENRRVQQATVKDKVR
jgi:DDE_Tnp_1-associated